MGKKDNVFDVALIGEQHHQTVNADSHAAGWGHAVFHGRYKILIHGLSFFIAGFTQAALSDISLFSDSGSITTGGVTVAGDVTIKILADYTSQAALKTTAAAFITIVLEGVGDGIVDDYQDLIDRGYLLTFA